MHEPFSRHAFALVKGRLVGTLVLEGNGVAVDNGEFRVGSIALTALVAFNARELSRVSGDEELATAATAMTTAVTPAWDESLGIRADGGPDPRPSGRALTLESFLPLLVNDSHWDRVRGTITDPAAFQAPYGPRQRDRRHRATEPRATGEAPPGRSSTLLWLAARRRGDHDWSSQLAETTLAGAVASGWPE